MVTLVARVAEGVRVIAENKAALQAHPKVLRFLIRIMLGRFLAESARVTAPGRRFQSSLNFRKFDVANVLAASYMAFNVSFRVKIAAISRISAIIF